LSERKRYSRKQRLGTRDIVALLSGGQTIKRSGFGVSLKRNSLGGPRLGVIVPKRVLPRAVDRNRVKRLVREWFRNNQSRLGNRDILIRVTNKVVTMAELEFGMEDPS